MFIDQSGYGGHDAHGTGGGGREGWGRAGRGRKV